MLSPDVIEPRIIERRLVHTSPSVRIRDYSARKHHGSLSGRNPAFRLIIPYQGLFEWRVGKSADYLDPTCMTFSARHSEFTARAPCEIERQGAIVITTGEAVEDELFWQRRKLSDGLQTDVALPIPPGIRLPIHEWLLRFEANQLDPAFCDELALQMLRTAMSLRIGPAFGAAKTAKRAKEVVHARFQEKLSLQDIADDVNVTPVYLTQCFSRAEGIPLNRYVLHLRLAHSLLELPHCDDITALALDLGFSSHSHFTTAFKAFAGISPSAFRTHCRFPSGNRVARA